MDDQQTVRLRLPLAVLEKLLRKGELHLEQVRSMDEASHRAVRRLVKQSLVSRLPT